MERFDHQARAVDWERLQRYVEGDQRAFAELVAAHVDTVYGAALRQVRSPELAEEVVQAVFIILARRASTLDRETILPAWLHRTAFYTARNTIKQAARRRRHERRAAAGEAFGEDRTAGGPTWQRLSPALDAGVANLREADRQAIVLRFFQRQSLAEVGRTMGISEDAAQMRVSRAVGRLRAFFVRAGVTLDTCSLANVIWTNTRPRPVAMETARAVLRAVRQSRVTPAAAGGAFAAGVADETARTMARARAAFVSVAVAAILFAVGAAVVVVEHVVLSGPHTHRAVVDEPAE
jgi:RNA polymerase sigma factor (sigma-70 family)